MAISVVMPALELTQETGKLVAWRKKEGERVAKGEPLLEVETDKAVVEIEAPAEGILSGIQAHEGAVIPVGETIAWILVPGEALPVKQTTAGINSKLSPQPARPDAAAANISDQNNDRPIAKISPKARRLAREHGFALAGVQGSGADGEILASDIEALISQTAGRPPASAKASFEIESLSSAARLMAERTARSWTTVPHFFVTRHADASALLVQRDRLNAGTDNTSGVRVTHTDLLAALVARVLTRHSRLNATWTGDAVRINNDINIGIAIATNDAVVAPMIHKADVANIQAIAARRSELSERARAGRLQPADLTGATFTISNLGMYRVDAFSAIIVQPQAAILAVGSIADRVVAIDGKPVVRPMMTLTLSCDHRVVDGARAAAFLRDIVEAIGKPESLLE
jgi:pyruvate dehydrogenase E2 component (dihydrolipoamide acetyltransferase)